MPLVLLCTTQLVSTPVRGQPNTAATTLPWHFLPPQLTHDSVLLRFALPTPKTVLGLPVGMCFKIFCPNKTGTVKGEWNGRPDPEDGA